MSTKKAINVIEAVIESGAHRGVSYLSPKLVIRVTRNLYRHGKPHFARGKLEFNVIIGSPNYVERIFIKKLLKAKEPFPVKKTQFKFPPKKKK